MCVHKAQQFASVRAIVANVHIIEESMSEK